MGRIISEDGMVSEVKVERFWFTRQPIILIFSTGGLILILLKLQHLGAWNTTAAIINLKVLIVEIVLTLINVNFTTTLPEVGIT